MSGEIPDFCAHYRESTGKFTERESTYAISFVIVLTLKSAFNKAKDFVYRNRNFASLFRRATSRHQMVIPPEKNTQPFKTTTERARTTRSEGAIRTHSAGAKSDGNTRSEGAIRTHSAGAKIGAAQPSKQGKVSPLRPELMKTFHQS